LLVLALPQQLGSILRRFPMRIGLVHGTGF
jgi:hypothetical protein